MSRQQRLPGFALDKRLRHAGNRCHAEKSVPYPCRVAERMHFYNQSHFSRYVKKELGVSPTEYRNELEKKKVMATFLLLDYHCLFYLL